MTTKSLVSALTIAAVGLGSKGFLKYLCSDVRVVGLWRLLDALERPHPQHRKGKGVLTVSNHVSVLDDPLMWGILPSSHYTKARPMRWALGASDICFTNRLHAAFFRQGQVLETFRGKGIYQAAVDKAINLLNAGEWVHIFPEGRISQPARSNLRRLKWGTGRILMEVEQTPTVIPIWLTGFDDVMPEARGFPKFLPRPGKGVRVTFGESDTLQLHINTTLNRTSSFYSGPLVDSVKFDVRARITCIIQDELEKLGRQVAAQIKGGK